MARVVEIGVDAGAFLLGESMTATEGVVGLEELVRRATGELVANTVTVRTDRGSDSTGSEGPEGSARA